MSEELDALIERLRIAYAAADRRGPGPFIFTGYVGALNGRCTCALVVSLDSLAARAAAAKALMG